MTDDTKKPPKLSSDVQQFAETFSTSDIGTEAEPLGGDYEEDDTLTQSMRKVLGSEEPENAESEEQGQVYGPNGPEVVLHAQPGDVSDESDIGFWAEEDDIDNLNEVEEYESDDDNDTEIEPDSTIELYGEESIDELEQEFGSGAPEEDLDNEFAGFDDDQDYFEEKAGLKPILKKYGIPAGVTVAFLGIAMFIMFPSSDKPVDNQRINANRALAEEQGSRPIVDARNNNVTPAESEDELVQRVKDIAANRSDVNVNQVDNVAMSGIKPESKSPLRNEPLGRIEESRQNVIDGAANQQPLTQSLREEKLRKAATLRQVDAIQADRVARMQGELAVVESKYEETLASNQQLTDEVAKLKTLLSEQLRDSRSNTARVTQRTSSAPIFDQSAANIGGYVMYRESQASNNTPSAKSAPEVIEAPKTRLKRESTLAITPKWSITSQSMSVANVVNANCEVIGVSRGSDIPGVGRVSDISDGYLVAGRNRVVSRKYLRSRGEIAKADASPGQRCVSRVLAPSVKAYPMKGVGIIPVPVNASNLQDGSSKHGGGH